MLSHCAQRRVWILRLTPPQNHFLRRTCSFLKLPDLKVKPRQFYLNLQSLGLKNTTWLSLQTVGQRHLPLFHRERDHWCKADSDRAQTPWISHSVCLQIMFWGFFFYYILLDILQVPPILYLSILLLLRQSALSRVMIVSNFFLFTKDWGHHVPERSIMFSQPSWDDLCLENTVSAESTT